MFAQQKHHYKYIDVDVACDDISNLFALYMDLLVEQLFHENDIITNGFGGYGIDFQNYDSVSNIHHNLCVYIQVPEKMSQNYIREINIAQRIKSNGI